MPAPFHILIWGNPSEGLDRLLLHVRQAGVELDWQYHRTVQELLSHLEAAPDLILPTPRHPGFDAAKLIRLMDTRVLDIPLLIATPKLESTVTTWLAQWQHH